MELVEVVTEPVAVVRFTRRDLILLFVLGERHYDAECRRAVALGGALWGARNMAALSPLNEAVSCRMTARELDTAAKVCEGIVPAGVLEGERTALYAQLAGALRAVHDA